MTWNPQGLITRRHFLSYDTGDLTAPPPLHIRSACPGGNHVPAPRPLPGCQGVQPGPALVSGGSGLPLIGIDPTDMTTWAGRGYRQSAGMIGWLGQPDDYRGLDELNPLGMQ